MFLPYICWADCGLQMLQCVQEVPGWLSTVPLKSAHSIVSRDAQVSRVILQLTGSFAGDAACGHDSKSYRRNCIIQQRTCCALAAMRYFNKIIAYHLQCVETQGPDFKSKDAFMKWLEHTACWLTSAWQHAMHCHVRIFSWRWVPSIDDFVHCSSSKAFTNTLYHRITKISWRSTAV